jgi:hypothetical protein
MTKLRTRLRAWLLTTWEPPAGVWARVAVAADGRILVALAAVGMCGRVTVPPDVPVWFDPGVFHALDFIAARMLDAASARSGVGDLRVAAALEAAGEAFADAVERAARTPSAITISEDTR